MMKIVTNISDTVFVHDLIAYSPIEKQVFDILKKKFKNIAYDLEDGTPSFILDGSRCSLEVGNGKKSKRKSVTNAIRLSLIPERWTFDSRKYPAIRFPYNKDISKNIDEFYDIVKKIQNLETRAKNLPKIDCAKIKKILDKELGTDKVEVSIWLMNDDLLNREEMTFYLHPKGRAPADGVLMCFEKDGKIELYWNGSTEKRKDRYGQELSIEQAFGKTWKNKSDIASLKSAIEDITNLTTKLEKFKATAHLELMEMLDVKRQAAELVKEFEDLPYKRPKS